jgi:1-acyl-sn-glycerol-3-phosphate acyltransferase
MSLLLFWPGWLVFRIIAMRYHLRAEGRENLPGQVQPLIVISNHNSRRDPVLINLMMRRPVHYMAKKESFDWHNGIFEYLMVRLFGAFPVDREHPGPEVIRTTEKLLADGGCIGIFPEGTRFPDQLLHPFEGGAAYFAWKTGATLLPIAVFKDGGEVVRFGKPFKIPEMEGRPRDVLPRITDIIKGKILELLPPDWDMMPQ